MLVVFAGVAVTSNGLDDSAKEFTGCVFENLVGSDRRGDDIRQREATGFGGVIVFSSLRLPLRWSFHLLLQLICTFLYRTLHPSPFYPGSLRPFLYSLSSSLPLLTRLPRHQVTMHLSEIADPDIAEVTRLASLLPTSSTPSSLSLTPVETYT